MSENVVETSHVENASATAESKPIDWKVDYSDLLKGALSNQTVISSLVVGPSSLNYIKNGATSYDDNSIQFTPQVIGSVAYSRRIPFSATVTVVLNGVTINPMDIQNAKIVAVAPDVITAIPSYNNGLSTATIPSSYKNTKVWMGYGSSPCLWTNGSMCFVDNPLMNLFQSTNVKPNGQAGCLTNLDRLSIDTSKRFVSRDRLLSHNKSPLCLDTTNDLQNFAPQFPTIKQNFYASQNLALTYDQLAGQDPADCCNDLENVMGTHYASRGKFKPTSIKFYNSPTSSVVMDQKIVGGIMCPIVGNDVYFGTLRQELTFDLEEFISNDILQGYENSPDSVFTSLTSMYIELVYNTNKSRIICTSVPKSAPVMNYVIDSSVGHTGGSAVPPTGNTLSLSLLTDKQFTLGASTTSISVSITKPSICLKAITVPSTADIASSCVIPYYAKKVISQSFPLESGKDTIYTLTINTEPLPEIPSYMIIYAVNNAQRDAFKIPSNLGPSTMIIHGVSVAIGEDLNALGTASEMGLFDLSKKNGLVQYNISDIKGRIAPCVPKVDDLLRDATLGGVTGNIVLQDAQNCALATQRHLKTVGGCGSRVVLSFGDDIPLRLGYAPGMACAQTFSVTVTVSDPLNTAFANGCELRVFLLSKQWLVLGNGTSTTSGRLLSATQVAEALAGIKNVRNVVEDHVVIGGNIISSLATRIKRYAPVVQHYINKAIHNAPAYVQQGKNALNFANEISKDMGYKGLPKSYHENAEKAQHISNKLKSFTRQNRAGDW